MKKAIEVECTIKGGTMTAEGFVQHKLHPAGFLMPVRLNTRNKKNSPAAITEKQHPAKDEAGNYVYVMPGGVDYK